MNVVCSVIEIANLPHEHFKFSSSDKVAGDQYLVASSASFTLTIVFKHLDQKIEEGIHPNPKLFTNLNIIKQLVNSG